MPFYVYKCPECGAVTELRLRIKERNAVVRCTACVPVDNFRSGKREYPKMDRQVTAPGGFKGLEVNH